MTITTTTTTITTTTHTTSPISIYIDISVYIYIYICNIYPWPFWLKFGSTPVALGLTIGHEIFLLAGLMVSIRSRTDVLHAFASQIGYAARRARTHLSDSDRLLFLSPVDDVLQDLGTALRPSSTSRASFASARPNIRQEIELLAALASPSAPVKQPISLPPPEKVDSLQHPGIVDRLTAIEANLAALSNACQYPAGWCYHNGVPIQESSSEAFSSSLSACAAPFVPGAAVSSDSTEEALEEQAEHVYFDCDDGHECETHPSCPIRPIPATLPDPCVTEATILGTEPQRQSLFSSAIGGASIFGPPSDSAGSLPFKFNTSPSISSTSSFDVSSIFSPEAAETAKANIRAMTSIDWKLQPSALTPTNKEIESVERALDPRGVYRHSPSIANPLSDDSQFARDFASVVKARSKGEKWLPNG